MPVVSTVLVAFVVVAASPEADNDVFCGLVEKGVTMSDGMKVRLPAPLMADELDAEAQNAVLAELCDTRPPLEEVLKKSSSAPVVTKVRSIKQGDEKTPAIRAIDVWFVTHGDWKTLNSKAFLESLAQRDEEGKNRVVSKSGILTPEEIDKRKSYGIDLDVPFGANGSPVPEWRIVYSTFSLLERVEISATRFAEVARDEDSVLAAARIDPRFTDDEEYPNQWRPWLRDERAEITLGPPHPYTHAGGYAKVTRLQQPAGAAFIEFHLVFEEPYDWFDGVNLIRQKAPLMVQEKVRAFRRKLAVASEETK